MPIRVLDKQTANRIAAGEVVERPASVIKELIENAVDAGAKRIVVELKKGGMSYLRVTDDGRGIPDDQVETAFLRHATSKIASGDDLDNICTLGFRGEALASIAAVSRVQMLTRTPDKLAGTSLSLEAGEVVEHLEAGCPVGTTMIVRDLFFNTPARMKFLHSDAAETAHVTDLVGKCMLARPEVAFQYLSNGRTAYRSQGDGQLLPVIHTVLGREYAKGMLPVDYREDAITITGYVGNFSLTRSDRRHQLFFLNGRNINSRMLSAAVSEGYKNAMMIGKFPVCVLHITMPPALVDVNVHPTKLEVRFSDEKQIYNAVCFAVRDAISAIKHIPEVKHEPRNQPPSQLEIPIIARRPAPLTPPPIREPKPAEPAARVPSSVAEYQRPTTLLQENPDAANQPAPPQLVRDLDHAPLSATPYANLDFAVAGQIFGTYILVQQGDELLLIDQHAAHERLCFEELVEDYKNRSVSSQIMLLPLTLGLDPLDFQTVMENIPLFTDIGFEIAEFGHQQIIIRAVPVLQTDAALAETIRTLARLIRDHANDPDGLLVEQVLHTVACKRAVKGNRTLTKQEMERLCERVLALPGINTCPHGRPIMIKLRKTDLEKMFKRIV